MAHQREGVVTTLKQHASKTPSTTTSLRASDETESEQEPQEEGEKKEQHGQPSEDKYNQPLEHTPTDQVSWFDGGILFV